MAQESSPAETEVLAWTHAESGMAVEFTFNEEGVVAEDGRGDCVVIKDGERIPATFVWFESDEDALERVILTYGENQELTLEYIEQGMSFSDGERIFAPPEELLHNVYRIQSAMNARTLILASMQFQFEYGRYPISFDELMGENPREIRFLDESSLLVCPFAPEEQVGYVLLPLEEPHDPATVLLYGKSLMTDGTRVVGRADGSVNFEEWSPESEAATDD